MQIKTVCYVTFIILRAKTSFKFNIFCENTQFEFYHCSEPYFFVFLEVGFKLLEEIYL